MFDKGATSSSAPLEAAVAAAAEILLQLSRVDLSVPPPPKLVAGLTWPSAVKGKRSRRDSSLKERRMRLSPSSPFDLSGGSGASTSGSSSPEDLRLYNAGAGLISGLTSASSSKVLDFKCFFLKSFFSFLFLFAVTVIRCRDEIFNGTFPATNLMALEYRLLC
jgi:hypothetical protein